MAEFNATAPAGSALTTIVPSPVTNLHTTGVGTLSVGLAWTAPLRGTPPLRYTVFMRQAGAGWWSIVAETTRTSAQINNLKPKTAYDFEIMVDNT